MEATATAEATAIQPQETQENAKQKGTAEGAEDAKVCPKCGVVWPGDEEGEADRSGCVRKHTMPVPLTSYTTRTEECYERELEASVPVEVALKACGYAADAASRQCDPECLSQESAMQLSDGHGWEWTKRAALERARAEYQAEVGG